MEVTKLLCYPPAPLAAPPSAGPMLLLPPMVMPAAPEAAPAATVPKAVGRGDLVVARGFVRVWAERAQALEAALLKRTMPDGSPVRLPWTDGNNSSTTRSSTRRALWAQLMQLYLDGALGVVFSPNNHQQDGFWGIMRVETIAAADGRQRLDACHIPSVATAIKRDPKMRKWVVRVWRLAGLFEKKPSDGGLVIEYDGAKHDAYVRRNRAGNRHRPPPATAGAALLLDVAAKAAAAKL